MRHNIIMLLFFLAAGFTMLSLVVDDSFFIVGMAFGLAGLIGDYLTKKFGS